MNIRSGLSLIELIVVLAILTALSALAVPLTQMSEVSEREKALREALIETRRAINLYRDARADDGKSPYPASIGCLLASMPVQLRASGTHDFGPYLPGYPRNPFANDTRNDFWWELKDAKNGNWTGPYSSVAQDFQVNDGVFDIRYPSAGMSNNGSIDGTNYVDW